MKKSVLALALLLVVALLAGLWFALGSEPPRPVARLDTTAAPTTAPAPAAEVADIAPPSSAEPEARETVVVERDASRAARLLADAQWVEVEVELPAQTPTDERLELIAVGFAPDRFPTEDAAREALLSYRSITDKGGWFGGDSLFKPVQADELACERSADGRFRAPFPSGSKVGLLRLKTRYVYAEESVRVELPSERVRIATQLGAWLTGTLVLPTVLPADIDASALEHFAVTLNGWSMGGGGNHGAQVQIEHELAFEIGGLRPALTYFVSAEPPQFANFGEMNLKATAGEHVERTYTLTLGARVTGRVLDATGAPLADARVYAEVSKRRMFDFGSDRDDTTDAEGVFALRGLSTGKLKLHASAKGAVEAVSDELEIADGEARAGVELRLGAGNTLAGRVLMPDGSPAASAKVQVTEKKASEDGARRRSRESAKQEATADTDGRFSIGGLKAEQVAVVAELEQKFTDAAGKERDDKLRVRRADVPVGVELALTLEASQRVRGRVVDDLGQPLAIFTLKKTEVIEQDDWRNPSSIDVFHDERGEFEIALPAGTWDLSGESEGHATSPKQRLKLPGASEEIVLTLPRAVALAGVVLDPSGAPIAAAEVEVQRTEGRNGFGGNGTDEKSDAEGRFAFDDVAPGGVTLSAKHADFAPSEEFAVALVAGEPVTGIELRLRVGGRLEGEIYEASGGPDAGRQVIVGNFGMGSAQMGGNATSDAAGRFTVEHLAPGKYNVIATPRMDQLANADADFDQAEMMASLKMTSVEIRDGETSHVILGALPKSPVRVSGRITAGGEPFTAGMLMVIAEGKSMLDSMKMVKIESDGRYAVTVDGAGDYSFIIGSGMGDDHSAEFSETIPEAESHGIDFAVPLGGIRGRVLASDGTPLEGIPVSAQAEGRSSLLLVDMGRQISTDADGQFEFQRLKPGSYTIRAGAGRFDSFRTTARKHAVAVRTGFEVKADEVLAGVELRLDTPGVIEGLVLDADGKPVARAAVFVRNAEGRVLNPVSTCLSDGLGKFTFDGAAPGNYTVSARSGKLASREVSSARVVADAKSEVEVRLEPGTVLRVSVADENDKLVRASLRVTDDSGREVSGLFGADALESLMTEGFSTTEQRLGPLPQGKYKVTATSTDGSSVTKSVTLTGNEERFLRIKLKD